MQNDRESKSDSPHRHLPFWVKYYRYIAFIVLGASIFVLFRSVLSIESKMREIAALNSAEDLVRAIESFRTLYTSEVVEMVRNQGIEVTHNYRDKVGAIPLPVTMSMV